MSGRLSSTRVPLPGLLSTTSSAPTACARSRIEQQTEVSLRRTPDGGEPGAVVGHDKLEPPVDGARVDHGVRGAGMALDVGQRLGEHPQHDDGDVGRYLGQPLVAAQLDAHAAMREARAQLLERGRRPPRPGATIMPFSRERTVLVRRRHRRAEPLPAGLVGGLEQRELAHGEREVLREAVVDLGGQSHPLAVERGALELLAQLGGGDAGAQQVAEQAQHRGGAGVDRRQRLGAADHHAEPARAGAEREHEPGVGGRRERMLHQPLAAVVQHERSVALHGELPRLLVEHQAIARADRRAGRDRDALEDGRVARRDVERRDQEPERVTHLLERSLRQLRQRDRAHQRPRRASDGTMDVRRGLGGHGHTLPSQPCRFASWSPTTIASCARAPPRCSAPTSESRSSASRTTGARRSRSPSGASRTSCCSTSTCPRSTGSRRARGCKRRAAPRC